MRDDMKKAIEKIRSYDGPALRLMEVCGTHTMQMYKTGIRQLLPEHVRVVSGPGCPVCVTPSNYIDHAAAIARQHDVTILTYGDMIRVPGNTGSLESERAKGADIRIVLSPLEAVEAALSQRDKNFVFLAVGFETTTPATALAVRHAEEAALKNLHFLLAHKTMPPALRYLMEAKNRIDAFIYPGHVAAITGMKPFHDIMEAGMSGVVTGFEAEDLVRGIRILLSQKAKGKPFCVNAYERVVPDNGNPAARKLADDIFEPCDAVWRGLGLLHDSGLQFRGKYSEYDAGSLYPFNSIAAEPPGCMCGSVLTGEIEPAECALFGHTCNPSCPVGACMVSSEGSCAAAYRYQAEVNV